MSTISGDMNAKFTIEISPSRDFERVKHLLPMMYLVDSQHTIEGLSVDPDEKRAHLIAGSRDFRLQQSFPIAIEQIEIHVPEVFEVEILKGAQQFLTQVLPTTSAAAAASTTTAQGYKNVNIQ